MATVQHKCTMEGRMILQLVLSQALRGEPNDCFSLNSRTVLVELA